MRLARTALALATAIAVALMPRLASAVGPEPKPLSPPVQITVGYQKVGHLAPMVQVADQLKKLGVEVKMVEFVRYADARTEIADQVCGILSDPLFGELFGPGSLGEAPLAATLPDGRVIAGTVDRLLVQERRISVIDFKTGRVPEGDAQVPAGHRAQMAAYAQALAVIFPGREVRAALLYTAGPKLIEVMP